MVKSFLTPKAKSSMFWLETKKASPTINCHLGFNLVKLGYRLISQLDFRTEAKSPFMDFAKRTQETLHLMVLDQNEALICW